MPKTPSYRQRKGYAQALVTLTDSVTKKRRDYWLGEFNSAESRERYHRVIAEWEALGRRLPEPDFDHPTTSTESSHADGPSIDDLALRFWRWAQANYRPQEARSFRPVLRLLRQMDGSTPASDFGPNRLRLVREAMVRGDESADPPRKPWSRSHINQQVQKVRRVFKWAASHEMIPPSVHQALATVEPLKRGRSAANETVKVTPAPMELVEAARPFMNRQVLAMFDLPTVTKSEKRQYTLFRRRLLGDGFVQMQYSVYIRHCASRENANAHFRRVESMVPPDGEVRLITITDKQYERMGVFVGKRRRPPEQPPVQLELF